MILIRFFLISIIIYLLIRAIVKSFEQQKPSTPMTDHGKQEKAPEKKISKEIGEYIDYEELDK